MTATESKYSHYLIHICAWTAILGMPMLFNGVDRPMLNGKEYLHFLLVPLSFMAVFYINYFFLIQRHLYTQQLGRFLGWNGLLIVAVMLTVHIFSHYVLPVPPRGAEMHPHGDVVRFLASNVILYLLVIGASVAIRMTSGWYQAEAARQQLEHIHTQAELQNLKSQLNPHFLFNTLNNIYSLIVIDSDRAQQAVHDLSRLLRYVLYESSQATVPLKSEIDFLRDYIELMRIRQPRHVQVAIALPEAPSMTSVAPLLFISLVENAFKHGVSNDRPSHISIAIEESQGELTCRIQNSNFPKSSHDCSGSGIGLANLRKRLEMIYPGRYQFECGEQGNDYLATLTIKL
jgi:hypothetical protein